MTFSSEVFFFLMFCIQAFSFIGLTFILWVSACFLILSLRLFFDSESPLVFFFFSFVAIASIFLLLLPFPSAWSYCLDCYSHPLEQHFLLALILNYLFHSRLIQMAFGIQISWVWYCKPQSSSWKKKVSPNLFRVKRVRKACCELSVSAQISPAELSLLPQFGRSALLS